MSEPWSLLFPYRNPGKFSGLLRIPRLDIGQDMKQQLHEVALDVKRRQGFTWSLKGG